MEGADSEDGEATQDQDEKVVLPESLRSSSSWNRSAEASRSEEPAQSRPPQKGKVTKMAYGEPKKSLRFGTNKASYSRGRPRARSFVKRRRTIVPYGIELPARGVVR